MKKKMVRTGTIAAFLMAVILFSSVFSAYTALAASVEDQVQEAETASAAETVEESAGDPASWEQEEQQGEELQEEEQLLQDGNPAEDDKTNSLQPSGPQESEEEVQVIEEAEGKAVSDEISNSISGTQEETIDTGEMREQDSEWFLPELCEDQTVSGTYTYPGYDKYSLTDGIKIDQKTVETSDGKVFNKRFNAGAPGKDESGNYKFESSRSMRIDLEELSNITVYAQSSGNARILRLVDSAGVTCKDFVAVGKDDPLSPSPACNVEAGVYYLFSPSSTVYTYGIHILSGEAPRRAWSDVSNPVITKVTREDDV